MPRTTFTIPFGAGLDRLSGSAVVDRASQIDLRNVHLGPGRLELRKGLGPSTGLAIGWGTDVVALTAVRKTGLLAVVVYDSATRGVRLYSTDGVTVSLVSALWTIPSAVAGHLPRILLADVYDHVFVAHDEQLFAHRQTTKVFDVTASTVADLKANLDRGASPTAIKFRGVVRHLNYLVGWGYGTATEPDRPETLRISVAGDGTSFVPEHYFLVGARSDPIVAAGPIGGDERLELGVGKGSELWRLAGFDRATFGVVPMDHEYGVLTSRSHLTVNGEWIVWTPQAGPRSTKGGPTIDLAAPLDLYGAAPDNAATPNDDGFTWHDPTEHEAVFCFGTWCYVLHLRDAPRRWSYRPYSLALSAAGVLVTATGTGSLNFITATIGSIVVNTPAYTPGADSPTFTVPWTLVGTPTGNETVEVWGRSAYSGDWSKLGQAAASAGTVVVTAPHFLTSYELAVRVVAAGTPGLGFTSTPDTWPALSRATATSAGSISTFALAELWERRSPTEHGRPFTFKGAGSTRASNPELVFFYEQSTDGGTTWIPHGRPLSVPGSFIGGSRLLRSLTGRYAEPLAGSIHGNEDRLASVKYRLTVIGPSASAGPTGATSAAVLAPGAPTIDAIRADSGELALSDRHLHPIFLSAGTHGGPIEVRARHSPDGTWSPTYTIPGGEVDAVILLDNTGGADDIAVEAVTHIDDDYSVVVTASASFP